MGLSLPQEMTEIKVDWPRCCSYEDCYRIQLIEVVPEPAKPPCVLYVEHRLAPN
jgi:hypothetical protein